MAQTARGGRPLAVVAQQWTVPRWLVDPGVYVVQVADIYDDDLERAHVYFEYRVQVDPDELFLRLLTESGGSEYDDVFAFSRRAQLERPIAPR